MKEIVEIIQFDDGAEFLKAVAAVNTGKDDRTNKKGFADADDQYHALLTSDKKEKAQVVCRTGGFLRKGLYHVGAHAGAYGDRQ